jgi:hypothetical protein
MDYLNPDGAQERAIKSRVLKCYNAANPSKVAEIDKLLKKYKNREHVLFGQLRVKYSTFPECESI